MKRLLCLAGAATLLLGTAAMAQTPPPPRGPRPGPEADAPPPPGGPRRADGPPPPPPPPPSKAAHFIFERGDARIDVKCADDEPTKACADTIVQLLDKLQTLKPGDGR